MYPCEILVLTSGLLHPGVGNSFLNLPKAQILMASNQNEKCLLCLQQLFPSSTDNPKRCCYRWSSLPPSLQNHGTKLPYSQRLNFNDEELLQQLPKSIYMYMYTYLSIYLS